MATAEPTAACSYADLARIADENCEPFESLSQCNRFIKAASMLRRRQPAELEHAGERISLRDLERQLEEARKAREVFMLSSSPATVIVPPDILR